MFTVHVWVTTGFRLGGTYPPDGTDGRACGRMDAAGRDGQRSDMVADVLNMAASR